MDATAPQIGVNFSCVPRQCDAIAEHPCIQWRRFGGFASACSSNWRIASERLRACPIDVKLSRATPVSAHRYTHETPLTKGPMRLRTLTRTATKTRAPRSDNGSQRDRAFLGENLLKRHASPVSSLRFSTLHYYTCLFFVAYSIPFGLSCHHRVNHIERDGSDLTALALACGRHV
jgi:hypothetical protein